MDKSNGYEEIADRFIAGRGRSARGVGAAVVARWSAVLPDGAAVLDMGCGTGVPISRVLIERGFNVYGVDASARMVAAFGAGFPGVPVQCAAVEDSDFFNRTFDGVVAWGLFFLLPAQVQRELLGKVAAVLRSGGTLLFTAPRDACEWPDVLTGRASVSLGHKAYEDALEAGGMSLIETGRDEGENDFYIVAKR